MRVLVAAQHHIQGSCGGAAAVRLVRNRDGAVDVLVYVYGMM